MKKTMIPIAMLLAVASMGAYSCSKDNNESHTLKVKMTDNPYNAQEVNVDIKEVKVKYNDDSTSTDGWQTLSTNARVYNLLGLQNGVDTVIATGNVPTDVVREIRFVLGTNNSIKIGGQTYPLTIPSGSESGLKLKVDKKLQGSLDSLLIDFDADMSVHQTGNGTYMLKPVLRVK